MSGTKINTAKLGEYSFTVNNDGKIEINSIKNKSVFQIAAKSNVNGNEFLENGEIVTFLDKLRNLMRLAGKENLFNSVINDCTGSTKYSEKRDENNNLVEQSYYIKGGSDATFTYGFENNKPTTVRAVYKNGKTAIFDLKTKKTWYVDKDGNKGKEYPISDANYEFISQFKFIFNNKTSLMERIKNRFSPQKK